MDYIKGEEIEEGEVMAAGKHNAHGQLLVWQVLFFRARARQGLAAGALVCSDPSANLLGKTCAASGTITVKVKAYFRLND